MEWEEPLISLSHLRARFKEYAQKAGVHPETQQGLDELLGSNTVAGLLELPRDAWDSVLVRVGAALIGLAWKLGSKNGGHLGTLNRSHFWRGALHCLGLCAQPACPLHVM